MVKLNHLPVPRKREKSRTIPIFGKAPFGYKELSLSSLGLSDPLRSQFSDYHLEFWFLPKKAWQRAVAEVNSD